MFCSALPDEYSYARFRVSRFKAENRADLINSTTINDGLLAMPENVMDFVRLYMEKKIEISALRRKENYDIPLPAIREGILMQSAIEIIPLQGLIISWTFFRTGLKLRAPARFHQG